MIELVDPRGRPAVVSRQLAPGAGSVRRVGFLCNEAAHLTGPHFEGYTEVLEAAFRGRFDDLVFERVVKPSLSRPASDDMLDRLAGCDGVVNGLAK